jgi:hypothetical protein
VNREAAENFAKMGPEVLFNIIQKFQDGRRCNLQRELGKVAYHLLVHNPVAFPYPRVDFPLGKKFLDWDSKRPVEGREQPEKLLLLAKADRVDEGCAMCAIQGDKRMSSVRVGPVGKVGRNIR